MNQSEGEVVKVLNERIGSGAWGSIRECVDGGLLSACMSYFHLVDDVRVLPDQELKLSATCD